MATTQVAPELLKYVTAIDCDSDCSSYLPLNNGLELPCKTWTSYESNLLRELMLEDNELFTSGLVRRVPRSSLGNSLRIRKQGIDVGPIRTESSGAAKVSDCEIHYDNFTIADYEKTFYIVNLEKNIQLCTRDYIGTSWQEMISNQIAGYEAENFPNTDLADLIIAGIITEYRRFLPEFMVMAVCDGAGRYNHGDDGILAKAFYAANGQFFHTYLYDLSEVKNDFNNVYIHSITGGKQYKKAPTDFASADQYLLDFVDHLNGLKDTNRGVFNASIDLNSNELIVSSVFAVRSIDLKIILGGSEPITDWLCKSTLATLLPPTQLQNRMLINDTPLLFQYENIDSSNFVEHFKERIKEFKQFTRRNGHNIADNQIRIAIDPFLMDERTAQLQNFVIEGNQNTQIMLSALGLGDARFIPMNHLSETGLYYMTVPRNLLQLDDGDNTGGQMLNAGRISIKEACDKPGMVNVHGNIPPLGSEVDHFGLFASNLIDSPFVLDNKLADREPCENGKLNIACYNDANKEQCITESTCRISCNVEITASYDGSTNITTFTVNVNSNTPSGTTLVYDLAYQLSDGTSQDGITTGLFTFDLPGDQTDDGLVVHVTGTITAQIAAEDQCVGYVNGKETFGDGLGYTLCAASDTNDTTGNPIGTQISLNYTLAGNNVVAPLVDVGLSYENPLNFEDIENEIEAILPGTMVTLTDDSPNITINIANLPSFITNVFLSGTVNSTNNLVIVCD
jgi:hypothetical protein